MTTMAHPSQLCSLRLFCNRTLGELGGLPADLWAEVFHNILLCLDGGSWDEKGELGNNFRVFIGWYAADRIL